MKIVKHTLDYQDQKTNILYFFPDLDVELKSTFAIFTHGYTSDKSSIINWPIRLAEVGVPCALFDLPGHFLGNYSEVTDFDHFKEHAHKLFLEAFKGLSATFIKEFPLNEDFTQGPDFKLVLGGHSLGAMLALKAMSEEELSAINKLAIGVGLGHAPTNVVHLFDTPFYKSTLNVREQLVSKALCPDNVFPWIKDEKNNLTLSNSTVHLITGEDDLVVGNDGMERLAASLELNNNVVTMEKPSKLPHHEPQLAASHVKKYLKKINWI